MAILRPTHSATITLGVVSGVCLNQLTRPSQLRTADRSADQGNADHKLVFKRES